MKPTLGLVFGLASEARIVLGRRRWRMVNGRPVHYRRLHDDTSLIAVQSGVGGERALSAAHWLISEGATALAAIGLSGGLYPGLCAGDLLIAAAVLQVDGVKSTSVWDTDADCAVRALSTLSAEGISVHYGMAATTLQAFLTSEKKEALFLQTRALAVDMESTAIARAAEASHLPIFLLRAICDPSRTTVPKEIFDCLDHDGNVGHKALLRNLLCQPSLVGAIVRITRQYAAASVALKRAWLALMKRRLPAYIATRYSDGSA